MALPDFLKYEVGTPITWNSSGGSYALTLTSVTNGNGRQGAKGDLGANRARLWEVLFTSSVGSAATAGNEIELYWGASESATAGTTCSARCSRAIVSAVTGRATVNVFIAGTQFLSSSVTGKAAKR